MAPLVRLGNIWVPIDEFVERIVPESTEKEETDMSEQNLWDVFTCLVQERSGDCRIEAEHTGDIYTLDEWMRSAGDIELLKRHKIRVEGDRIISEMLVEVSYRVIE